MSEPTWRLGRRQVLVGAVGAGVALSAGGLLTACGAGSAQPAAGGSGSSGTASTFRFGANVLPSQLSNYNPFQTTGNWSQVFDYLFDALLYFNPVQGQIVPRLATAYQWDAKATTLTATLHPGAVWHDGQALTADDVVFTYTALKNEPVLDTYGLWRYLKSVTAPAPDRVVFTVAQPFPSLPAYLTQIYIVPKHIWASQQPSQFLNTPPVGSGPFMFDHYTPGTDLRLKRNARYFLPPAHMAYLDVVMYQSTSDSTLALMQGEIDTTGGGVAMPSLPALLAKPGMQMQKYPGLSNYGVFMNNANPLLQNAAVRQAVAAAINRSALIQQGEMGAVFPANPGWLPSTFGHYTDTALISDPAYGYNPQRAVSLLQQAGFTKGADGIFADSRGNRLSFTYYQAESAPAQDKEAAMNQQSLKAVGIDTQPRSLTWPALTKQAQSGQFDLVQMGGSFPPDPQAALSAYFASNESAPVGQNTTGLNYTRYRNATVDGLLAQAAVTTDDKQRTSLYMQVQQIIAKDAPIAMMYNVGGHVPYSTAHFTGYPKDLPVDSSFGLRALRPR